MVLCSSAFGALSINGYRNAVINPPAQDQRGVFPQLTALVSRSGLNVILDGAQVRAEDATSTCTIGYSQYGDLTQYCQLVVKDLLSGSIVAQTTQWSRMRLGIAGCVTGSIENAWKALHYTGFSDAANQANIEVLFPKRPSVPITENQIRAMTLTSPIEGIWTDSENRSTIGIIRDPSRKYGDYIGVILQASLPIWTPGEIKMELRETAVGDAYTGNIYIGNKLRIGTSLTLESGETLLRYDWSIPGGRLNHAIWIKSFPKVASAAHSAGATLASQPKASWSGSGFLISPSGLIATNYHVIESAMSLRVSFQSAGKEFTAKVILKDPNNDLAILQIDGFSLAALKQSEIPYGLRHTRAVSIGDPIFTMGFPLSDILGQNVKYANGSISSKSGLLDDMVHLQINAPVQPGNSGSPLFDANGNVIGIVVSSLNSDWMHKHFGSLPQNVNFAVKADYLINLIEMLPEATKLEESKTRLSPTELEPFVCLISAE